MAPVSFAHRFAAFAAVALLVACSRPGATGGPSPEMPEQTLSQFLAAVNASDYERMASLWGDERGPSNVTNFIEPVERRRRLEIMQRLLVTDGFRVLEARNMPNGHLMNVELNRGTRSFSVPFTLVRSRYGGWLVNEIGLDMAVPQPGSGNRP